MIKRLIFYTLCLSLVFIGVFNVYENYKTEEIDSAPISTIKYDISSSMTTAGLNIQILNLKQDEYLFALFFDKDDINSQYMFNVTLTSITQKREITQIDNLLLVDISDLSEESRYNLKSRYGFSSVPALAKLSHVSGGINAENVIQEDSFTLLTESTVEAWLIENKLIEPLLES